MALAATAVVSLPSIAAAQTTAATNRGFPIGEKSRIHTNFDTAIGFDSNPPRVDPATSDWKAHFRPSIEVDVPGSSVDLGLRGQFFIEQFFGTSGQAGDTKFGGDVGARLRLGSEDSVVGFELRDTLARTPSFFAELGTVGADEIRLEQWHNRGLANLVLRPGGGALEFRLGYGNELLLYDQLPKSQNHTANLEAKWKFFPKTALVFGADLGFFSATTVGGSETNRASPLNISLGLQGQITPRLSTMLRVGYGDTFSWSGDFFSTIASENVRTVIVMTDFTYALMPGSSISIGFNRLVRPVILLDSYSSNAPYAKIQLSLMSRLMFGVYGSYEFREFGGAGAQTGSTQVAMVDTRVDYWFFEFLKGGLVYQLVHQTQGDAANPLLEEFTRHQALFTVGLYY